MLETKRVSTDSLFLDPSNARKHDKKNMDAIKGSLAKFGQVEPLVVQKSTRIVIGGNGRLQAMRDMGAADCDVVELDIDAVQASALALTLNRTSELAEWDIGVLGDMLTALSDDGFDLDAIGFDEFTVGLLTGGGISNPEGEWEGMPEFTQDDKTGVRSLIVHFKTNADAQEFSALIGQGLTEKTKSIWFPKAEIETMMDKRYVDES